jgi:hypothetical protein
MNRADNLPRWAYLLLALACICMGLWASYITLQYFEHGAKALESDVSLQALAVAAALMFVASEMGAFALAALLSERQLWARRWMLTVFAVAVLGLEVVTIVAVQLALTTGADMTQATVVTSAAGLQKQINAVERDAASFAATAEALRADKQVSKAMKASDKASAEQAKATALYAELAKVQTQKRPTLVGLLGHDNAIYYAVARGILVSLGGLVFFGTAGALMRAARGAAAPGEVSAGTAAPATAPATAPAQNTAPAETAAPGATPAPAPASFKTAETVAPKDYSTGLSYSSKIKLAGAGLLAATAAPMAHSAPAVPAAGASKPVHADVAETIQQSAKKPRAKRAVRAKLDTGVEGHAGARFKRIRAGVLAGKIRPSVRGIQAVEGGSQDVVTDYLRQLETEGVIVRAGRGFALATLTKKSGAA